MKAVPLVELLPTFEETGVYPLRADHGPELVAACSELRYLLRRVDLSGCNDDATLFARIADALAFPSWFGHNWDALADSLSDLEWLDEFPGYVLWFLRADRFRGDDDDSFQRLVEVLDDACLHWRDAGKPFWAFVSDAPEWVK